MSKESIIRGAKTILLFMGLGLMSLLLFKSGSAQKILLSPLSPFSPIKPLSGDKHTKEVFGFLPHWKIDQVDNIDFGTLTTLAYFDVKIRANGDIDKSDGAYEIFKSKKSTEIFKKAHKAGTKVVLTITQMEPGTIRRFLNDEKAQKNAITQVVDEVDGRGIDGVNIDIEYIGDPGDAYRQKLVKFSQNLTSAMHQKNSNSQVTISVLAGSVKETNIYDIRGLSTATDGIFMMAYDYATKSADRAMPTSPLYGYDDGTYWYDVSSAVDDFLTQMPANKLIMGVPWYGYEYPVAEPANGAPLYQYTRRVKQTYKVGRKTYWRYRTITVKPDSSVATYTFAKNGIQKGKDGIVDVQEGWDDVGKVGWKAYKNENESYWRMTYVENAKSLDHKYDFATDKNLAGVGVWALGFDKDTNELWDQLEDKFGNKPKNVELSARNIIEAKD